MNKIYKVIWSKVRNCYVAVSEIAKRNGKSCTSVNCGAKVNRGHAGVALAIALSLSMTGGGVAWAVDVTTDTEIPNNTYAADSSTIDFTLAKDPAPSGEANSGITFTVKNGGKVQSIGSAQSGNTIKIQSGAVVATTGAALIGGIKNNSITVAGSVTGNVYGGSNNSYYPITGNKVEISDGTVNGLVCGGYTYAGSAGGEDIINGNTVTKQGNTVTINGGTITYGVYGGHVASSTGSAINNKVEIKDGTVSKEVYGGYLAGSTGSATNNTVTISGTSTIGSSSTEGSTSIFGGRALKNATNNTVNINLTTNGKIWGNVYGGWVNNNSPVAKDNSVTVDAGEISGNVYGGFALIGGSVEGNSVSMKGTVGGYIYGGIIRNANSDENVENNHVTITNGTVTKAVYGGSNAGTGSTINNSVTINGGTVKLTVLGGYSSTGNVGGTNAGDRNTVTITDGTIGNNIFGGYVGSESGSAQNNKVSISGTSTIGSSSTNVIIYGGNAAGSGSATQNEVEINLASTGKIWGHVIGGYSSSGNAGGANTGDGNTVTISGGTVSGYVRGGHVSNGAGSVQNNEVAISGVNTSVGSVYGGYSGSTGAVTKNTVTIEAGTVNSEVYGGYTYEGTAGGTGQNDGNTVTINGGTVSKDIFGGYVHRQSGSAENNTVTVSGTSKIGTSTAGTTIYSVYGGKTNNGSATQNTVTINLTAGETTEETGKIYGSVYGGHSSGSGAVTKNTVTIEAGTVNVEVYGGYSTSGNAGAENARNIVNISNGNASTVYGGKSDSGSASYNTVNITNGSAVYVYGGITDSSTTGEASHNIVSLTDSVVGGAIYGGSSKGNVTDNVVTINKGRYEGIIFGGYGRSTAGVSVNQVIISDGNLIGGQAFGGYHTGSGNVTGNILTISGGTINKDIYGGEAYSGNATENTVVISGGSFTGNRSIYGGAQYNTSDEKNVDNNVITIAGGSFTNTKKIYGGSIIGSGTETPITNNTVNLYGTVTGLTDAHFYGAYYKSDSTIMGTGNELHIGGTKTAAMLAESTSAAAWTGTTDNKVASVNNFNSIVLHNVNWSTTMPALAAGSFTNNSILDISGIDILGTKTPGPMALLQSDNDDLGSMTLTYKDANDATQTNKEIGSDGIPLKSISLTGTDTATTGVTLGYTQAQTKVVRTTDNTAINYVISPEFKTATLGAMNWDEGRTFVSDDVFDSGGLAVSFGSDFKVTDAADQENGQSFNLLDLSATSGTIKDSPSTSVTVSKANQPVTTDNKLKFSWTRSDTVVKNSDGKKLVYTTGATSNVATATFDGEIAWNTENPYYDASGKGYSFNSDTAIDATNLTFSGTTSENPVNQSMTLIANATDITGNHITQSAAGKGTVTVNGYTENGWTFDGKAKGTVSVEESAVKYTINSVGTDTVTLGELAWGTTDRSLPSGWTASASTTIDDTNFAYTGTANKKLKKNDTAVILNATGLTTDSHVTLGTSANKTVGMNFTDNGTGGSGINFVGTVNGHVAAAADAVNYVVVGVTLDSIDLAGWTGTAYSIADSDGWAEKTGGISVATEDMTYLPELAAGAKTDILTTTSSDIDFRNANISETNQYTASDFTPVAGNGVVKLTGMQSRGVKAGDDGKSLVYAVSKKNVNSVVLGADAEDNVTPIAWNGSEAAYSATSDYDFTGVTTVDASKLSFTFTDEQKAALSDASEMMLLSGATNLAEGKVVTGESRTQTIGYNTANGIALTSTLAGTVSTVAGAVKYEADSMTLDSVNLANWNGTSSSAVPTGWTANASGVAVATEGMANLPNLAAGATQEILTTGTADYFRDDKISEANKYKAYELTPSEENKVTLSGTQSKGVKTNENKSGLVYAVGKMDVSKISFGEMAWEIGRTASSDYDFASVATVDASGLSFTLTDEQKEVLSANSEMTLLSNATNLAAGKDVTGASRTQTFGYNTANGAALTGTLSGTVSTVAGAVKYEADSMTLDSVNLANWNGTSSSAVPTGWTANTSGVTVATENMANLPNLAAGTSQEILTTGTADYFRDDKISEANKYKAYELTPSEENKVTLSGTQSKGVKTNENKSGLVYAVGKMDVSKISFGEMAWEIGRTASSDYDFASVATVDASGLSFTLTDEQKEVLSANSEMTLLSNATNLAAGKDVTGASRTQTFGYNTANGAALTGTLSGTVSTVAGAVKYEADSMTLDSVNLANWNGTSSSAVPTGWTANTSGVTVATENMANLPNLAAGTSQEILTTGTANYFSDDKISEANKYKAYDLTPSEENKVTLSGTQSKGVKTNENKSGLVYAVGKMDVSKISFGEMVWGTGRNASGDYDFASVATVDASGLSFTLTDEQKSGLSADSEMTLLSNATNLAEGKSVTGASRTQTMDYNAANGAALTGTLAGTVSTVAGAVKYEADSMTLDSVNLANWNGTSSSAVPTGWTANTSGVTVSTDNMANLPNLAAGTSQEILTTGTANYFRDDKISEANKYKAYELTPSEENKVTLSGTQSKGVKTNENKSGLVYAVGKMDVSKISFGEMAWGTGRNASGDYDFANVATVDASDLAFTFTDEQKAGLSADSEMTLLSGATNLAAGKSITGANRTQTMDYNAANGAALTGTLAGTVSTVAGAVKYEAGSMTLDSVNLANWNGTSSSAVPNGWTANTSGVTIATDGMTVPEVAAGKHIDIVKGNADGFFANATINGSNKYQAASFEETDGGIAFKGTQSRGVTLNEEKNHIIYAVGTKNVDTAAITGEIAWDTGKAYYENTKYAFTGSSETDISGVKFTADTDPLNQSMTLITNAAGTVKDGSPEFAIALCNTSLKATATGTAAVDSGNLKYTVTGVTLDAVTVNSVGSDAIPAGWGAAKNVQVDTDSMTVPAGAAFGRPLTIMTAGSAFFADENITGSKKYGANPAAFNDTNTTGAITVEGKQDAGVKASADGKSLLYEVGHKEASSVTIGAVDWSQGATLFDGSSAEYDYSGITALGTSGFDVAFSAPETVAAGESMTLLKANATLKDMAAETKSASYSFNPVAGVAIDAAITGNLAVTGGAVTYTAAENRASKLTFTNVDWKDSGALMTRPSNITFSGADVDTAKISFQNIKELEANKQMTLVSDFGDKVGTITGSKYTVGTGLEGEGAASLSGSDLIFTAKTAAKDMAAQEQTHNTLMAMEADIALLAAGNEHISQTMDSLAAPGNVGADGTAIGASMGGGASRYETGSHVSTHNWNAAVAVGSSRESKSGKLEWGVFGEYGKSSYKLHGNVGTGDGDSHYAGGGIMAKWTNKHDVYTEASFRMGRMSDDAKDLLYDAMGNGYGYDVHANYFGAHVGVGKIVKYKGGRSLDVYGKYFYTKRDGVDFTAGGSSYRLDSVASSLLRIGARYGTTDKKWNWYGGLAYEYEFDGKSDGTVSTGGVSAAIRAASIKGSSVRGEIGMKMNATRTNPWQVDVSLYGYGGKHRGFGGNVNVAYMF